MTTGGQIGRVAENAVGPPGHEVGDARSDVEAAAGAAVGLDGLQLGDRLHVPLAAAANFGAPPPGREPFDIEFGMLVSRTSRPTAGSVRARHEPSLGQYQPTSCECAQAPQGVP